MHYAKEFLIKLQSSLNIINGGTAQAEKSFLQNSSKEGAMSERKGRWKVDIEIKVEEKEKGSKIMGFIEHDQLRVK